MFTHNLLVLIYTKLHSKSCDYLNKAVKYAQGAQVWPAAQIFIAKHKKKTMAVTKVMCETIEMLELIKIQKRKQK